MSSNRIRKEDIADLDIVDAYELASDGYGPSSIYLSTPCVSTTGTTKTVVVSLSADGNGILYNYEFPVQSGDIVWVHNTAGTIGDGYFTVDQVIDNVTFTVNETMVNSTGGTVQYRYPAGASAVGFNPTGLSITANNVQDAIAQLVGNPPGINVLIDGVPAGTVSAVNVETDGFVDAKVASGTLTISASSYILDVDGSLTYVDDGVILKKVVP